MENTDLFKIRSYSGCIRSAWRLMSGNFKTIFRHTWKAALACSVFATATMLFSLPDKGIHDLGMSNPLITMLVALLTSIGSLLSASWMLAELYSLLNDYGFKTNFRRSLALQLFTLILGAYFLFQTFVPGTPLWVVGIISLLLLVCMFPLAFAQTKFIADKSRTLHHLLMNDYAQGWRHFGYIFLTFFLTGIIMCVIGAIVLLPFCVIIFAQVFNQLGMLDGDPNGAPGYFFPMLLATSTISVFLFNYLLIWCFLVEYYMYGSIEQNDREKAARKQALLTAEPALS